MKCSSIFTSSLLASILLFPGVLAQHQTQAQLSGKVTDETGGALPGVEIRLANVDTGHRWKTISGDTGTFLLPFVQAGTYTLEAKLNGFSTFRMESIHVVVNQELDLGVVMNVGGINEAITVQALPNPVESTSSTIRYILAAKEIENLPILTDIGVNGGDRNVLDSLTALTPGANFMPLNDFGASSSRVRQMSINGTPPSGVGFSFDGIDNTGHGELFSAGPISMGPNPDAVSEFSVLTHTYKAEAGSDPAIVQVSTKGGQNDWHGQVRAIYLDPALVARDFFDWWGKPEVSTKVLGGQISGPVIIPGLYKGRDKTFFLFDLERYWKVEGNTSIQTVPTNAERNGDFSALPENLWPIDPSTETAFPNGVIPQDRILSQSEFYVDQFIPRANRGESEYATLEEDFNRATQFTVRIDHQFSERDNLSGTFFYRRGYWNFPQVSPGARFEVDDQWRNLSLHYVRAFSPSSVNSLTFGGSDTFRDQARLSSVTGMTPADLGFNIIHPTLSPYSLPTVSLQGGGPSVDSTNGKDRWSSSTWSFKDSFSWIQGNHSLKLGADIRWPKSTSLLSSFGMPRFFFAPWNENGTGNVFADFLIGSPDRYQQSEDEYSVPRRTLSSFYFQDDFRIRPNITLNLGLRYELNSSWSLDSGKNAAFRPGVQSSVYPDAPQGIIYTGDLDPQTASMLDRNITPVDRDNLAPRIGIAFSPSAEDGFWGKLMGGPNRTAIRAGYGIFYMPGSSGLPFDMCCLEPWVYQAFRDSDTLKAAGANFADPWGSDPNPYPITDEDRFFSGDLIAAPLIDPNLREPFQYQWSLSIQRQFNEGIAIEVAYIGNTARNLFRRFEGNPGLLTEDANLSNVNSRRRYPEFWKVGGVRSDGKSNYHSLQLMASRRFASGIQFNVNYVLSKALDNGDSEFEPWGRSLYDRRHSFAGTFLWPIPGSHNNKVVDILLAQWQVTSILRFASGNPINIRNSDDSTLQGIPDGMPDIVGSFRKLNPRQVRTFTLPSGQTVTGNFFFDPTVFVPVLPSGPEEARFGNLGRNVFTGPGVNNIDLSLKKRFPITESQRIDFRVDVSNLLNHAQFNLPQGQDVGRTWSLFQVGRLVRTFNARRIQLYLSYSF